MWYKDNWHRFPQLDHVARQYMCTSPTHAGSEHLFSQEGLVVSKQCNRIHPNNAEMLVFIASNIGLG